MKNVFDFKILNVYFEYYMLTMIYIYIYDFAKIFDYLYNKYLFNFLKLFNLYIYIYLLIERIK